MGQLYGRPAPFMLERVSQTIELPRTGGPGTGLGGAWKVIVRNDDHNTFDHVARTLARVIPGVTVALGHQIANVIHNSGTAIVYTGLQELVAIIARAIDGVGGGAIAQRDRGHAVERLLEGVGAKTGRIPGEDDRARHQGRSPRSSARGTPPLTRPPPRGSRPVRRRSC